MAAYRSSAALPAGPAAQARPPARTVTPTTASATRRSPRIPGSFASRQALLRTGCTRFLTVFVSGTPQVELLHLLRSAKSAKVPPRRDVGPYLVSPVLCRQERRSSRFAGGAAAGESPHTTTPGRPDPTDARGLPCSPHIPYPEGRDVGPFLVARGPVYSRTQRNPRQMVGVRGLPGVPIDGQPRSGRTNGCRGCPMPMVA
jgi:hypothetical protein